MKIQKAINTVYEGLIGENSIPVNLRMKKELDYDKLSEIRESIKYLISFYSNKSEVPKKLACCFIDIYGAFSFKKDFYSEEKLIEYEDIGIELQKFAEDLLGPS